MFRHQILLGSFPFSLYLTPPPHNMDKAEANKPSRFWPPSESTNCAEMACLKILSKAITVEYLCIKYLFIKIGN